MIPDLVKIKHSPWGVLPVGIHTTTLDDVRARYAFTPRRQRLLDGFIRGAANLFTCGCQFLYLDGSFVTEKIDPGDFDCCWHEAGVNTGFMDVVFRDFSNGRKAQKEKYFGEFFPASFQDLTNQGISYLELFQKDKHTGEPKGILRLENWLD